MKKVFLLPNFITAFGLMCGLFAIFKMNMTGIGETTTPLLTQISGILILAAILDLLDGAIARVMKAESEFGGLFDSLADAITFGLAPSVIILKTLSLRPGSEMSFFLTFAAMVFTVCGVLRLIRFNVMNKKIEQDDELLAASKKNFTGLPIPAAAGAAISCNLLLSSISDGMEEGFPLGLRSWILFFVLLFLGYVMISRWRFPSLKTLHFRVSSFKVVIFTVFAAVLVFFGIQHNFPLLFFGVIWLYLLGSLILSIIRLIAGRRTKALEDFERAPEDEELGE
ncbi:CDP-alcohol phosphatidyltransferase family protein [Criblamydia sequanensis]|uniref:CDP-diacylglycerol--serine O-phosphatidyltransferase PssA n=1 Tax=Candidatus Criblamydia sequanensis CRIB-18 TaxID=1437425 RepID=A0A090CXW9_9BACT|nr:CDP-alcohol phosphatidyltransferase family protein [Criblamydia sequanensis]CDR32931.1 putative CDP-diacylglycerol--serine O-phosphatidyltransferase PssA [Criblamydia sequanensis CRIB-18]